RGHVRSTRVAGDSRHDRDARAEDDRVASQLGHAVQEPIDGCDGSRRSSAGRLKGRDAPDAGQSSRPARLAGRGPGRSARRSAGNHRPCRHSLHDRNDASRKGEAMKALIHDDFLLESDVARDLYHRYVEHLPIIDYHCHLPVAHIASNHQFRSMAEIWLEGDHYKWRAMRTNGVDERYCTGDASEWEE